MSSIKVWFSSGQIQESEEKKAKNSPRPRPPCSPRTSCCPTRCPRSERTTVQSATPNWIKIVSVKSEMRRESIVLCFFFLTAWHANLSRQYLDEGGDGSIGDRHDCRLTLKYMYDLATLTKSEPGSRSQWFTWQIGPLLILSKLKLKSLVAITEVVAFKQRPWSARCTWSAWRPWTCPRIYLQCSPGKNGRLESL